MALSDKNGILFIEKRAFKNTKFTKNHFFGVEQAYILKAVFRLRLKVLKFMI